MEAGGVNCIDLYTPNPEFRSNLGRALRGRREKFVLQAHLCTIWKDGQYKRTRDLAEVKEGFADQLRRLETDHAEIGMIHYVDSLADWETVRTGGVLDYARELKAQGVIRAIGLSSHNPEVALAAVNSGAIEVLMFSINPCYDLQPAGEDVEQLWNEKNYEQPLVNMDPQRQELYETCQRLGVGITVMKAFGGGDLLSAELSPAGKALTLYQCLHYALTRPGVASVMSGARNLEELKASIAYEDGPGGGAGLCRRLCRPAQDQLGGPLHVLRPLRPLPGGHRRGRRHQVPESGPGPGGGAGDRAGALRRAAPPRRGVHLLRGL